MRKTRLIHPWPLRLTHWLNVVAMVMMIGSGWQIYDGAPLFNFTFPPLLTIGAWLGAGIAWHLAFLWLFLPNGIVYVVWAVSSGHFAKFFPLRPRDIFHDLVAALRFRLHHEKGVYNAVQKLLYLGVLLAGVVIVVSGLAIWKPVQLWFFCNLCGGYFAARYVHFFAMTVIVAFIFVHVVMVALVPKTLPAMILGGEEQKNET